MITFNLALSCYFMNEHKRGRESVMTEYDSDNDRYIPSFCPPAALCPDQYYLDTY